MTRRAGGGPDPPRPADLDTHPVLSHLDGDERAAVLAHARVSPVASGETLFHAGDPARYFFVCRHGQLKLYRLGPRGNEKIVGLVDPGDSFAEAAAFMEQRAYPVHCAALRPAEVVGFDTAHFLALLRGSPESCIRLLGVVSQRLQRRVADIESLSLQNAQLRIVNYLLRLHERVGTVGRLPASKKHVAGLLAVQPETFSRVLTQLQNRSVLVVEGQRLHLLDRQTLAAIATGQQSL